MVTARRHGGTVVLLYLLCDRCGCGHRLGFANAMTASFVTDVLFDVTRQVFDAQSVDTWSLGTTLFMALLGVQPWEEVGDYKFQAIAEGRNLDVVLEGWKLRDVISEDAVDLLQVRT